MEPYATCTTVTGPVGEHLQASTEDTPLRQFHDSGVGHKYPDLLTYLLKLATYRFLTAYKTYAYHIIQYFGHVARASAGQLALTILEGSMEQTRYQGKPRRQWLNNIEDWTGYKYIQLKKMSVDKEQWRKKTRKWSAAVANPRRRKAD